MHGAKRRTIVKLFDAGTEVSAPPVCINKLPAQERIEERFAEIEYRHGRSFFCDVGELASEIPNQIGARVEINTRDCERGNLSRVTRVLIDSD